MPEVQEEELKESTPSVNFSPEENVTAGGGMKVGESMGGGNVMNKK